MKGSFPEEKVLRGVILPDLERGRPDFDRPHTEAVVYWMKVLVEGSGLDEKVMITAAYAHDWGYIDLFPEGSSYEAIQKMKSRHMEKGAEEIRGLLEGELSEGYSDAQIERVAHLVGVHDRLEQLKDEDEVMLAEADTLGALDVDRVKPTFSAGDNGKYLDEVKVRRRPLFVHERATRVFEELFKKRRDYYERRRYA